MNDDRKKFDAAVAFLTSRVSSGRCIRDPLADLHEALVPFHGKASGNPAALIEKPAESGLWRPVADKYGRMRNGRKAGPMIWSHYLQGWESFLGMGVWSEYGEFFSGKRERKVDLDLIAEWPESDDALWPPVAKPSAQPCPFCASSHTCPHHCLQADGRYSRHNHHPLDLVSEWIEPAEEPPLGMREGARFMQVREGAWYMRRDGKVKGPAKARRSRVAILHPWLVGGVTYTNGGTYLKAGEENKLDLIREVPAPEASE